MPLIEDFPGSTARSPEPTLIVMEYKELIDRNHQTFSDVRFSPDLACLKIFCTLSDV